MKYHAYALHRCALASFLLATLAGCTAGYTLLPARVDIINVSTQSFPAVADDLHDSLTKEGFKYLGKNQEMIAQLQHDNGMPREAKRSQLARLNRETSYSDAEHHLNVVLLNFTDGVPREIPLGSMPASNHFVEVEVYDERPGGFGSYGLAFYQRLLSKLKQRYGTSVRVINAPPPTNESEYRRITRRNTEVGVAGWFLAVVLSLLVTGSLSCWILRKQKISPRVKRLIFVVTNTWLVTPLPFPIASIFVIPAPNLFAFPWTSTAYYSDVASYARVSFPLTLVLCAAASMFLFGKRREAANRSPA
jgi:hypothetical protein